MVKRFFCFFAIFTFLASAARAADNNQKRSLEEIFKDPSLKGAVIGFIMLDLESGKTLYSMNPDRILMPASNMKLITSAAALLSLGTDFRYQTVFYAKEFNPASGAMAGLYVKGYGDPTISDNFFDSGEAAADVVASELAKTGLGKLEGTLWLDGSFFKDTNRPASWNAEDLGWCYAPRPSALATGGNCLKITAIGPPTKNGAPTLEFNPPLDPAMVNIDVSVSTKSSTRLSVSQNDAGVFTITGHVKRGTTVELEYPVRNPALFYGAVLTGALKRAGIAVKVRLRQRSDVPQGYAFFCKVLSPPLPEILSEMDRNSDNFVAEQILRTLGAARGGGGTHTAGATVISETMTRFNLATAQTLKVADGSGLSRENRLTPQVLLGVLSAFYNSYLKDTFISMLAAPGGEGTLKKRLAGTPAEGRLRAKTGALSGACSLSGYISRYNGRMAAFTIVINSYSVHSNHIRALQDEIVLNMLEM